MAAMEDLALQCFRDDIWLRSFPLNKQTALEYLSHSQFYDPGCCNEQLKVQLRPPEDEAALSLMTGVQYERVESGSEPALFVFRKIRRNGPSEATPLSYCYILHGSVYQCPNIHAVFTSRLVNSAHHLSKALGGLRDLVARTKEAMSQAAAEEANKAGTAPVGGVQSDVGATVSLEDQREGRAAVDDIFRGLASKYATRVPGLLLQHAKARTASDAGLTPPPSVPGSKQGSPRRRQLGGTIAGRAPGAAARAGAKKKRIVKPAGKGKGKGKKKKKIVKKTGVKKKKVKAKGATATGKTASVKLKKKTKVKMKTKTKVKTKKKKKKKTTTTASESGAPK
jgi:hypothetical protein